MSFVVQNITRTFFLSSKPLNALQICETVHCLLFIYFWMSFLCCFSSWTCNIISGTHVVASWFTRTSFVPCFKLCDNYWIFLLVLLRFSNAKHIHCTWLVCWQSPIIQLLPLPKDFNIEKRLPSFVCCFLLSKYIVSIVFDQFKLKKYQPHLSFFNLHSKNTKGTLFLSL